MEEKKKRMRELVEFLNRARRAYEQEDTEIISNYEYDYLKHSITENCSCILRISSLEG